MKTDAIICGNGYGSATTHRMSDYDDHDVSVPMIVSENYYSSAVIYRVSDHDVSPLLMGMVTVVP